MRDRSGVLRMVVLVCGVLGLGLCQRPAAAGTERHKWWHSEEVRAELGLSEAQSSEIETIFQSVRPELRAGWEQLDRLEKEVSRLMTEGTVDESRVSAAIDRVEDARSALNRTRTLMLFRMYRILTPEQRVKMQAFHERRDRERREGQMSGTKPR